MIPFFSLRKQNKKVQDNFIRVLAQTVKKGNYILGREVELFENEFAKYSKTRFGVGVGNGTDAITLALMACGIGPGDEVITVSHTAVATVAAIEAAGAKPVFVDIDPLYLTMDPQKIRSALTSKTKAIIPVHLYGQLADLSPILKLARKKSIKVIEDCAQAHGALYHGRPVGSLGDLGCFSFYPTKNLGALGDGGMVITNNASLAKKLKLIRQYGWRDRQNSLVVGRNSRLDEIQAAFLRIKLRHLPTYNANRGRIAAFYTKSLLTTSLGLPRRRAGCVPANHLYVIRSHRRNSLRAFLKKKGVETRIHYPKPVHLQPAYRKRIRGWNGLPETEKISSEILTLPLYPELNRADLENIISSIQTFDLG